MLSAANSPDRPCTSSKSPSLNSDEKGHPSERPSSSSEADPADGLEEAYHRHFRIRDYVFAHRSEGIGTNWPFPQQYLQLFLKHGVRDLLPPFEPPDLVRARLSEADHLISCSQLVLDGTQTEVPDAVKNDYRFPTQESVLDSSHQYQHRLSENKSAAVQAASCSQDRLLHGEAKWKVTSYGHTKSVPSSDSRFPGSVQDTRSTVSDLLSEVEVAKPPHATENVRGPSERSVKKCRLIVKFCGDVEPKRSDDIVPNFSSVTDPMATKVCPVCKNFSSTSNTTLNAHIDQCLSAESGAKENTTKLVQHKVKPRKKRSMEEICATAPHCTIEDLDRRNGTNWVSDLASIAQKNVISCITASKQPRISPVAEDKQKKVVYVDSNGTKLLILSNFNDVQSAAAVDSSGPKKCTKEPKNIRSLSGKRKWFPTRYRKCLKAKVQRKKMNSFSHLKGEMHKECKLHADNSCEEGLIPQASNVAREHIKGGEPGTLGHWICSKRSNLLKHLNNFSSRRKPRNLLAIEHHRSMESNQSTSCDYLAVGGHSQKFCKSSDENSTPSKTRSTDVLSHAVHASFNQGKRSANSPEKNARSLRNNHSTSNRIVQKIPQSSEKCVSSVKGKRGEIHGNAVQKSAKFQRLRKASVHRHPRAHEPEEGPTMSPLMDGQQHSLEVMKCKEVMQGVITKHLRKHQFAERPQKPIKESLLELAEGFQGSPNMDGLGSTSNTLTAGMQQSNFSEYVGRPETSNSFDHVSPYQGDTIGSDQVDVYNNVSEYGEFFTSKQTELATDCHHAEQTEIDAQAEVQANMNSMAKCSSEKTIGTCGNKIVTSEDIETAVCERLDTCPSHEYERQPNSANEATTEANIPQLLGDQGMPPGVSASDVVQQEIWQASQIDPHVQDAYSSVLQNMNVQADVAYAQDPSACLSRPMDKFLELSSVTSGRSGAAEIHNMIVDGEPSGSPVSASSTISHLSAEVLKSQDGEQEPLEGSVVIQEKLRSECGNFKSLMYDNITGTERRNLAKEFQKFSEIASSEGLEKFWDSQPCCCSQRERVPLKSRTLRQDAISGMVLPTNSPLYARPVVSSSGACSHSTSELNAIPIFDAPTGSTSVKASPKFEMGFPTFGCFGSASTSSNIQPSNNSSPILRLMGKNLMVMKKDEAPGQQQNQSAPSLSENTSNGTYMSLLGFSSTCSFSNVDAIQYHPHPCLQGSVFSGQHSSNYQEPIPSAAGRRACYAGTLLQNVEMTKADFHPHHKMLGENPSLSATYNQGTVWTSHELQTPTPATKAPTHWREIIVIEDSPDHEINEHSGSLQNPSSNIRTPFPGLEIRQFRSFPCYPSPNPVQPRDLRCGPRPGFPSFMPEV